MEARTRRLLTIFNCRYDTAEGDTEGGTTEGTTEGKAPDTFSQEQLNSVVAEEKRKADAKYANVMNELKLLQTKSTLSEEEKTALDTRITTLQNESKTKDELAKEQKEKASKQHAKELKASTEKASTFEKLYNSSIIRTEIINAAVKHNAVSADQIQAMLGSQLQVVQKVGEDNKPVNDWGVRVAFNTKDKDGAEVTLDLSVDDTIGRMVEDERYRNLFKQKGTGGFGGTSVPGQGGGSNVQRDYTKAAVNGNMADYIRARNEELGIKNE